MFEGIGRIHAYTEQKMLKLDAKVKAKTGRSLRDQLRDGAAAVSQLQTTKAGGRSVSDEMKITLIKQKLRSGKKLSSVEMKYLKENDTELYRKAKKADEAREELKSDLKRAKTKDEARQALMRASVKAAAEAMAELKGQGGGDVSLGSAGTASMGGDAGGMGGAPALSSDIAADIGTAAASPAADTGSAAGGAAAAAGNAAAEAGTGEAAASAAPSAEGSRAAGAESSDAESGDGKDAADKVEEKSSPLADGAQGGKFEFDEKFLYIIRALQDEWRQFVASKDFEELPENAQDKGAPIHHHPSGKRRYHTGNAADLAFAALAYKETGEALDRAAR